MHSTVGHVDIADCRDPVRVTGVGPSDTTTNVVDRPQTGSRVQVEGSQAALSMAVAEAARPGRIEN